MSSRKPLTLNANIIFLGDTQVGKSTFIDFIENGPRLPNDPNLQLTMGTKIPLYLPI